MKIYTQYELEHAREHQAIMDALEHKRKWHEFWRERNYGHDFGRDSKCSCGITRLEYLDTLGNDNKLCPKLDLEQERKKLWHKHTNCQKH